MTVCGLQMELQQLRDNTAADERPSEGVTAGMQAAAEEASAKVSTADHFLFFA